MRYPNINRKKPVLYLHPIHKEVAGKEALQNMGYSHRSWNRHMRQEETDAWCGQDGSGQGLWLYVR